MDGTDEIVMIYLIDRLLELIMKIDSKHIFLPTSSFIFVSSLVPNFVFYKVLTF